MGIKNWFERLKRKNSIGFVYKLEDETQKPSDTKPHDSKETVITMPEDDRNNDIDKHTSSDNENLVEDDVYEEDDPEQEFDKAQFMQRSVPIDHVIKVCISTYYDEDDKTDELEDIEYAYFLTNYKVSTIVKEAGKLVDIKCLQLTGDDMGTVYDDCAFDVYEDDEDCHTPALIISWTGNGMYGYSYDYYYKNDNLQESYSAVHEEICTNLSGLIDPETNTVQVLGLVQLSNSFNFQANRDKYDRRDSLESEKKEVEEFFGSEDE